MKKKKKLNDIKKGTRLPQQRRTGDIIIKRFLFVTDDEAK